MEQTYHETTKRLTRSSKGKVFGGVCGGLADYLDIDPVLVRVLFVGLTLISGGAFGVLLYLIGWIIIPLDTGVVSMSSDGRGSRMSGRRMLGVLLVIVGAIVLLASALPFAWYFSEAQIIGPLFLIIAGIVLIVWKREADAKDTAFSAYKTEEPRMESNMSSASEPYRTEHASTTPRRLYRLEKDRKIAGICSGLGEYFNIDPTIIRIFWIMLILIGGSGILLYLIMWLVMPLKVDPNPVLSGEAKN